MNNNVELWLAAGTRRRQILLDFTQPMTPAQVARRLETTIDVTSFVLREFRNRRLVEILTPTKLRSRVYWLTPTGIACQRRLLEKNRRFLPTHFVPAIDWRLYSFVCFSHRSAVVRALEEPLQPAAIKRRARFRDPDIRMSANNVRDVLRDLASKGIVRRVEVRGTAHPRYELTTVGAVLRALLIRAEGSNG